MKNLKVTALALVAILALASCDKNDDKPVNGKESITTDTATFNVVVQ